MAILASSRRDVKLEVLGIMLEILTILVGVFDLASIALAVVKYWRISIGFFAAASTMVVICLIASSPIIRWILGFHIFVLIITAAVLWEQKRGRLKD